MTPSPRRTRSRYSSPICAASSRPKPSRDCCTRSGELATSFARRVAHSVRRASARLTISFDRLPIRVRLAGVSALLTFIILCAFAVAIGSLTVHRIRSDFNRQVVDAANQLPSQLNIKVASFGGGYRFVGIQPPLSDFA